MDGFLLEIFNFHVKAAILCECVNMLFFQVFLVRVMLFFRD